MGTEKDTTKQIQAQGLKLPTDKKTIKPIYMSGTITEQPSGNAKAFREATDKVRGFGFEVVSPSENLSAWEKWAAQAKLSNVTINEYYLNIDSFVDGELSETQAEFLIKEIFLDGVNCQAIKIPGARVADFEIKITSNCYAKWDLQVKHKPTGKRGVAHDVIIEPYQSMITEGRYTLTHIFTALKASEYHTG